MRIAIHRRAFRESVPPPMVAAPVWRRARAAAADVRRAGWLFTPTCTCTRNIRARPAATSISSISRIGRARKGIAVVGTGDFVHPGWLAELKGKLEPAEPGLFRLNDEIEAGVARTLPASCRAPVRFMLEVEISTIYKKGERTRKIHHLIYVPDFATVDRIAARLARIGNIASDGRPILGLDFARPARDHARGEPGRLPGAGAYLDAVVRRARLAVGLRFDRRMLRRPRRSHLRGRDRALVRSGDELAGIVPRPLPPHLQFRRAFARQARARGDALRPARSTTSRSAARSRPATATAARSSSSPRRASITSTATASAACGSRRRKPLPTTGAARPAASR